MTKEHRDILQKNHAIFLNDLDIAGAVDHLFTVIVLTPELKNEIMAESVGSGVYCVEL